MDSCSTSQAEHGILWPAEILRLFRWSGHVLVESIPVVDLALESSNDKLARSVPALLANFIQLSNDSGWEIQGRRHSDDLLKLFPQQQIGYAGTGANAAYAKPWTTVFEHLTVRQFVNRILEHVGPHTSWVWQGGENERMFAFLKDGFNSMRPNERK